MPTPGAAAALPALAVVATAVREAASAVAVSRPAMVLILMGSSLSVVNW